MNRYKNNIKLDYVHTFFRNFIITHGIWLIFLYQKGFTFFEIGIFEAVFHISSLSMEIPTGIIADLYGRKLSRVLGIISYVVYILLIILTNNVFFMILAFFFCGLSYALESGSGEALIYDSLVILDEEEKFMKFLGKKEVLYQVSSSVAYLVGGLIAIISLELNFWLLIVVFVVALIPILKMTETLIKTNIKHKKMRELMYEQFIDSSKLVFSNKKLLFLIIIGAMMAAPITSLFFYFQIHLYELKYSYFLIGVFLAGHSILGSLGGYFAEEIEKKYGEKLVLYFIPIFIVILVWLIQIDDVVFIPFILLGFFDSIFYVVLSDYINKLIPSEQRATVLSFNGFAFSIIMIIIFPILGLIGQFSNLKLSFFVLAGLVSLFYIFLLFILKKTTIFSRTDS